MGMGRRPLLAAKLRFNFTSAELGSRKDGVAVFFDAEADEDDFLPDFPFLARAAASALALRSASRRRRASSSRLRRSAASISCCIRRSIFAFSEL